MGFTGSKADEFKMTYIQAFNKMEEIIKNGNQVSERDKLLISLFSKNPIEVAEAHKKLIELETAPLVATIEEQKPKVEYHDTVLNKPNLITTTVIAKDLGLKSAQKLNDILHHNGIIYKRDNTWCPYADYEWLIQERYCDFQSYDKEHATQSLKWTERGRKWIVENIERWKNNCTRVISVSSAAC